MWAVNDQKSSIQKYAINEARAGFEKDVIYRHWSAMHGGTYVPITDTTPQNPYLDHIAERDISTPSGKRLTLVNPAYMTRQVHELGEEQYGTKGHITSLNPIRPENRPDAWESESLKSFENGAVEAYAIKNIEDVDYLRFMRPLKVGKDCLKCHEKQGYVEGDIRGGISVSVPLAPYIAISQNHISNLIFIHGAIAFLGLFGLILSGFALNRKELEGISAANDLMQSEEKYRSLAEASFEGIAMSDKGVILEVNKKMCLMFGYSENELIGMKAIDVAIPEHKHRVENNIMSGYEHPYQITGLKKDGTTFPLEIQGKMFEFKGKHLRVASLKDITERIEAEKELQETQRQYRQLVEDIGPSNILFSHRLDGVLTYVSPSVKSVIGLDKENVIGKMWPDILDWETESIERASQNIRELVDGKEHATFEMTFFDKAKSEHNLLIQSHMIRPGQNHSSRIEGLVTDITDRKRAENALKEANEKLLAMAMQDGLTKLANRRNFDIKLAYEWRRMMRAKKPLSLLVFDVDYFKLYNDTYGHQAGDFCLQTIAEKAAQFFNRPGDILARYGGEEFAAILPDTTNEGATILAEKVCQCIREIQIAHDKSPVSHYVTLSCGVSSMIPNESASTNILIEIADKALYVAKSEGRNKVVGRSLD